VEGRQGALSTRGRVAACLAAVATLVPRGAAAQPTPAPPEAPIEITITGEQPEPGGKALGRRDVREMPGVLDDPYRAIEVSPGVSPAASGVPYYFIRGAPPGNIGYFFDGVDVPLLFHAGGGPSVIPAPMIKRVEFFPGPYPARFGRFAGAVVDAESTPPAAAWRGVFSLRALDVGGFVEGPIGDDVSVLVGGRYSAGAALLSALVPLVSLEYGDYQARATWRPSATEKLSLLVFGARDYLAIATTGDAKDKEIFLDSDFHRLDLRYERELARGDTVTAAVTLGLDQSRNLGVRSARQFKVAARSSALHHVGANGTVVRGGLDATLDRYLVTPCAGDCPGDDAGGTKSQLDDAYRQLFPSRVDLALGAWAEATLPLDDRSTITPAIRVDHYASLGNTAIAVDPKLVGRFGVGEHLHLIPTVAVASQLPGFAPLPALHIGGIPGGLQRSLQTSFGAEVKAGPMEAVATVFHHAIFNLNDPVGTERGGGFGPERFLTRSLGNTYGVEIGARGALRRNMFFVLSYTLSRATRTRDGLTIPSAYDRTHVAQAALLFDLGRGVRAGFRHVFYSGFPADEVGPDRLPSEHPDRTRPFYRLDVRLSKRWKVGTKGYVELALDLQNATLSKEVFDVACDKNGCTPRTIGPLTIPTLALEAGF
jgi:TonB-dependent receptor-like protein